MMANMTPKVRAEPDARMPRVQSSWYSVNRQAARNVVRINWARNVLDEERMHPSTHSAARVRRALKIVDSVQTEASS